MISEILAATLTVVGSYLAYRLYEIIGLAQDVITAYDDNEITEDEFKFIVEDLRKVVYKK